ncbi:hypothetical protein OGAPHI_002646 [Ogataea philodendri]|uniref:SPX domain-containing protein n=1 Tax=Ogataea philodendri TaxID=1378263 RepID=A0A9P8PBS9_9ASCO|nr:uncharacterized protein OGAPHI_002646 [Ogataea philodendri]KAH3668891.1 hypothetical protein OGAPHI_002646 [Ogataea philodendri]
MLFGVKLQNEIFPPWKDHYIKYDYLKRLLKENVIVSTEDSRHLGLSSEVSGWSEKDESTFATELDSELEKVYSFQISKYKELDEEISKLELQSEEYLKNLADKKAKEFDTRSFQKKLEELLSLAKELDHFARLNFTGFIKIVKKHDRLHKGYSVKALLNVRMKSLPLNNISEDTSPYLFRISTLYSFVRDQLGSSSLSTSLQNSIQKLSSSGKISTTPSASINNISQKEYGYKVLKFWIHPDNLMEIKTTILRHLPVLIYTNQNDDDDDDYNSDPIITALYFDNNHFELYNNKLLKNLNKTPSMRVRWTGKLKDNPELILEKKTFDYDTGNSNDVRLSLKEKYLNDFIFSDEKDDHDEMDFPVRHSSNSTNKLTYDKYVKRLEKRGLPKETIDKLSSNYKELQEFIKKNDLQPTLRTVHTRTAFQMPGDDRVRITIDSDILFIREDSFDHERPIRNPHEWHRIDIDSSIEDPYSLLRKGEYTKFPYSVMEIKLANSIFNNPSSRTLSWINDLTNGHLVKEVPNFSKFIQGISSLFLEDDNLDILPFWLPELETDIRKNPEQAYNDSREKQIKQKEQDEILKNFKKKVSEAPNPATTSGTVHLDQIVEEHEDLDDNESSDEESTSTLARSAPASKLPTPTAENTLATSAATHESKNVYDIPKKKKLNVASYLMPVFSKASKLEGYESEDEEIVLPPGVIKPKVLIRQSGPVKVEAKVWLANERTFVRWLHVTTLLSALTFTVYASVQSSHIPVVATNIAYIYFALTLFSGVWAYGIYMKRLELIKLRSGRHLDGVFGPLVLAVVLIISLGLEYYAGVKKYNEKHALVSAEGVLTTSNEEVNALHPVLKFWLQKIVNFVESI